MSGAPIVDSTDASKIFKNFDMMPSKKRLHRSSADEAQQTICRALYDRMSAVGPEAHIGQPVSGPAAQANPVFPERWFKPARCAF
jgi:hypothetical protein